MVKPAQHPPADFFEGEALRHLQFNLSRALDQSPKEVELLHIHIIKAMHSLGESAHTMAQHDLVQAVYQPAVNAISKSKAAAKAIEKIVAKYDLLPSTPTIRLAKDGSNSIMVAIFVGLVVGALIVGAACLYLAARY